MSPIHDKGASYSGKTRKRIHFGILWLTHAADSFRPLSLFPVLFVLRGHELLYRVTDAVIIILPMLVHLYRHEKLYATRGQFYAS